MKYSWRVINIIGKILVLFKKTILRYLKLILYEFEIEETISLKPYFTPEHFNFLS